VSLSLSVTDLDSFRRYREMEEMTLAELLRQLRREDPPNEAMLAGTALHSILETSAGDDLVSVQRNGFSFRFNVDAEISLAPIRELSGRQDYVIDGETVTLRGRVDEMDGITITDHKLTKNFDAQRYADRYQWRCYLSIFGASRFVYNLFIGEKAGESDAGIEWDVYDFHTLTFYRYPELESDVIRELGRYVEFANHHLVAA
jgi:hypothetical protein